MHRPLAAIFEELERGKEVLSRLFPKQFLPVLVPPWNRFSMQLLEPAAERGWTGLSGFGARVSASGSLPLVVNNCHCDPIGWKRGHVFRGGHKTVAQLVEHLEQRRLGQVDAGEATGFLTHHIAMDEDSWIFAERLLASLAEHSAARILHPREVFA
jgi:hypothetical protein